MAWGHRLKKLTRRERIWCRTLGWGCSVATCDEAADYVSTYSYASGSGHAAHATRTFCAEHARAFAMRYCLAWPTPDGRVRIRFEPQRLRAA